MSTRVVDGSGVMVGVSVKIGVADLGTASVGGGVIVMGPPMSGTVGSPGLHAASIIAISKMMLMGVMPNLMLVIFFTSAPSLRLNRQFAYTLHSG